MSIVGGDVLEITCNHPVLGNFNFSAKSNESYTLDVGGRRSNDDANGITGNGVFIDQVNIARWSFEGIIMARFISDEELTALPDLAGSPILGTWTFSHISGVIWKGNGKVVGDIQADTNNAQVTVKIAGGGKLEKLS